MKLLQFIGKALSVLWAPIRRHTVTFVALYVLGVVSAWLTVPHTPTAKLYDNLYWELFLDVYLLCVLLGPTPSPKEGGRKSIAGRLLLVWKFLVCLVLYAIAIADVYCFEKYGSSLSPSMLMLVGETDKREAGEFLSSVLQWETLTSGVGWLLLIGAAHIVLSKLIPNTSPHPERSSSIPAVAPTRSLSRSLPRREGGMNTPFAGKATFNANRSHLTWGGGGLVLLLLLFSLYTSWSNKQGLWRLLTLPTMGAVENELTQHHRVECYLPVYRLAFSVRANQLAARQINQLAEAADHVRVDSCGYTSPMIVLIIGESYNKHHAQLYGYDLPTTPRQLVRQRTGQLIAFSDVVTPWNLTSFVFKHMLSTHVIGQEGQWSDYPMMPVVFRKAGYDVTFLTNQFLPKAKDAVYDFSGGFFLNDARLSAAMFSRRNEKTHPWDDGLLKDWDAAPSAEPSLVIFHLLGQHLNYRSRFPKRQRHFTAADYEQRRADLPQRRRQLVADYDNAVLYNDSIVDQICRRFEEQNAVVVYVPDHGEEVYEPGRSIICRNHTDDIDAELAYHEYEIPFWVWCSKSYIAAHPDLFQRIRAAKDRRLMIDALPHMLMYLAGIHSKDYNEAYDILSDGYDEQRPRLLKGKVDYDKVIQLINNKGTR